MKLRKNDGTEDEIQVKPSENVTKFSLDSHLETWVPNKDADGNVIAETTFREVVYTEDTDNGNNSCLCDNFVLEAHYKVYFKESSTNAYEIVDFNVDIVYGSKEKKCDEEYIHTFNLKTSVTYLESKNSRKLSGSPGYLRGEPVIIGNVELVEYTDESGSTSLEDKIDINLNGFPLRGADDYGNCFYVDETVREPKEKLSDSVPNLDFLIGNYEEKTYFEDPVLTFEDSLVYGCKLELTLEELQDFCRNSYYKHLMLYQNLFLMKQVGVSGNADQHFASDWIDVEVVEDEDLFN